MINKKRKGNIMVVAAILLIILPSLLILTRMGGNSTKVLKKNMNFHQDLLISDSLILLGKETLKKELQEIQDIEVDRDITTINGLIVYGDYYIVPNMTVDITGVEEKIETRAALFDDFNIEVVDLKELTYDEKLTTFTRETIPYEHSLPVEYKVSITRNRIDTVYKIQMTAVFKVYVDTGTQKGYIGDIVITEATILEQGD